MFLMQAWFLRFFDIDIQYYNICFFSIIQIMYNELSFFDTRTLARGWPGVTLVAAVGSV